MQGFLRRSNAHTVLYLASQTFNSIKSAGEAAWLALIAAVSGFSPMLITLDSNPYCLFNYMIWRISADSALMKNEYQWIN